MIFVGYCHIRPGLIELNALRRLFTQRGFNGLFMLNSLYQLIDELIVLFFHLNLEEFSIGHDTTLVHDFVLLIGLHQFLGLFEVFVLTMADFV